MESKTYIKKEVTFFTAALKLAVLRETLKHCLLPAPTLPFMCVCGLSIKTIKKKAPLLSFKNTFRLSYIKEEVRRGPSTSFSFFRGVFQLTSVHSTTAFYESTSL